MRIPSATYRVQFNLNFRFADTEALVPDLYDLGITDLYASPRFKARRGSSHGYDVADPPQFVSSILGDSNNNRFLAIAGNISDFASASQTLACLNVRGGTHENK